MDPWMTLASGVVGIVVGLTGMGGGALMTPMLVLFFNVPPLAAVSSDLVSSAVMKPVGAAVHLRRGTVNAGLVKWLCVGSVPAAFAGVLLTRAIGGDDVDRLVGKAVGIALLVAAGGLIARAYVRLRERTKPEADDGAGIVVRPVATALVGAAGGLIVGMTSVGSGSLIIVALLALYPALRANELVGTDLLQAVPLVASAALGHILFGDFQFSVTASLLVGSIPGVWIGAQLSARAPGGLVRRALVFVLVASAMKTLGASNLATVIVLAAGLLIAPPVWMLARRYHGFSAVAGGERHMANS